MKLRKVRKLARISQWKLAAMSGVHQSRISLIENGLISARDDEKVRLCEAMAVNPWRIEWPEDVLNHQEGC